ncbi:MAG: hypothetical protein WEF86_10465 [Gemmatimonadota bacterium]
MPQLKTRRGAVLLVALLILMMVSCLVVGTLHLAILERRLAGNVDTALRLRLAAENAARLSLQAWTPGLDSMSRGIPPMLLLNGTTTDRIEYATTAERAGTAFLIRAEARRPPPSPARAAAALLVLPPPLPPGVPVAAAALSLGPAGLAPFIDRIITLGGAAAPDHMRVLHGPATLSQDFSGILLVYGDLIVQAGVRVRGLIVVGGRLDLGTGATVAGAAHALDVGGLDGEFTLDRDIVAELVDAARLRSAVPAPGRAWLPAF